MKRLFKKFLEPEQGQELIECALWMAFVAPPSSALFVGGGESIGIWPQTNSQLVAANANS